MRSKGFVVSLALMLVLLGGTTMISAAENAEGADAEAKEKRSKLPFALYLFTGVGAGEADAFNSSIQTTTNRISTNALELDEVEVGRFVIGWKLPNQKGDFRIRWDGYAEKSYTFNASGQQAILGLDATAPIETFSYNNPATFPLKWWDVQITDGMLDSWRNPPVWWDDLDANGNTLPDPDEIVYDLPGDFVVPNPTTNEYDIFSSYPTAFSMPTDDDLGNQYINIDLLYGREWGGRRYNGRWWTGLRYYEYKGNMLAAAWLQSSGVGRGYTDGLFLPLLNFHQESKAVGPTGALELNLNYFQRKLVLFGGVQAALMIANLEMDTGEFFTFVQAGSDSNALLSVPARLHTDRDKSVWHSRAEVGIRINLTSGVRIEAAYQINGYLDTILLPKAIQIPASTTQIRNGVSAIYSTQDIVLDTFRAGIGFQF